MNDSLEPLIERFPQLKILVLGDFILDEFVFGEISRVSREAPVLILKYRRTETAPGGGANTVANVEQLGAEAIPVGFLGKDEAAGSLLLEENGDRRSIPSAEAIRLAAIKP